MHSGIFYSVDYYIIFLFISLLEWLKNLFKEKTFVNYRNTNQHKFAPANYVNLPPPPPRPANTRKTSKEEEGRHFHAWNLISTT